MSRLFAPVLLVTVLLATSVLLAGCGDDEPRGRVGLPIPEGFGRLGGLANGLVLAIPTSWRAVDLTKDDYLQQLEATGLTGAALEQAKANMGALRQHRGVYAVDPASQQESPSDFFTNLNGFCQASVAATVDSLIELAKQQLTAIEATVSEATSIALGNGTGVRIRYTIPYGKTVVHGTQYYAPSQNGRTCVVTISTDLPGKEPLFDQIGTTLRPI